MFCVDIDFSPSFSVTRPRVDLMTTSARAFTTRHLTNILRNVYAFLSLGRLYHSVHGAFGSPSFRGTAGDHKGLCCPIWSACTYIRMPLVSASEQSEKGASCDERALPAAAPAASFRCASDLWPRRAAGGASGPLLVPRNAPGATPR